LYTLYQWLFIRVPTTPAADHANIKPFFKRIAYQALSVKNVPFDSALYFMLIFITVTEKNLNKQKISK
jgi:hypothetical protein